MSNTYNAIVDITKYSAVIGGHLYKLPRKYDGGLTGHVKIKGENIKYPVALTNDGRYAVLPSLGVSGDVLEYDLWVSDGYGGTKLVLRAECTLIETVSKNSDSVEYPPEFEGVIIIPNISSSEIESAKVLITSAPVLANEAVRLQDLDNYIKREGEQQTVSSDVNFSGQLQKNGVEIWDKQELTTPVQPSDNVDFSGNNTHQGENTFSGETNFTAKTTVPTPLTDYEATTKKFVEDTIQTALTAEKYSYTDVASAVSYIRTGNWQKNGTVQIITTDDSGLYSVRENISNHLGTFQELVDNGKLVKLAINVFDPTDNYRFEGDNEFTKKVIMSAGASLNADSEVNGQLTVNGNIVVGGATFSQDVTLKDGAKATSETKVNELVGAYVDKRSKSIVVDSDTTITLDTHEINITLNASAAITFQGGEDFISEHRLIINNTGMFGLTFSNLSGLHPTVSYEKTDIISVDGIAGKYVVLNHRRDI